MSKFYGTGHIMGNRLSKIATRTGDDGSTGLGDGSRVRKDDARIAAIARRRSCGISHISRRTRL